MDKNSDGTVDYNEFANVLGPYIHHLTKQNPATTTMKDDFIPVLEYVYYIVVPAQVDGCAA